jgi:hypothetical protein
MPSPHGTGRSSRYLAHDDVPTAMGGDDMSIRTTKEMEKYESFRRREFAHTCIYDVKLLKKVGLDEELPIILRTISWGKLYDEPHLGSRLLTLEFIMTFEIVEMGRKLFVKFIYLGNHLAVISPISVSFWTSVNLACLNQVL